MVVLRRGVPCLAAIAALMCLSGAASADPHVVTSERGAPASPPEQKRPIPEPPRPVVSVAAGLGYPELAHARLGVYVLPRIIVEGVYGWVQSSHLVGGGLTALLFGESRTEAPPLNALTLSVYLRNNAAREFGSEYSRDQFGVAAEAGAGYAYHADYGLLARAEVVITVSPDRHGVEVMPLLRVSAGWTFPFQD